MKPLRIAKHNIWQPHEVVLTSLTRTRTAVTWVSDKNTRACQSCGALFAFLVRRHHCRSCGQTICSDCSRIPTTGLPHIDPAGRRICNECECELECLSRGIDPQRVFDFIRWYLTSPESEALAKEAQRLEAIHSRLKQKLEAIVASQTMVDTETRETSETEIETERSSQTNDPSATRAAIEAESERINALVSDLSVQLTGVEKRLNAVHLRRGVVLPVQIPSPGMVPRHQTLGTNPASVTPSAQAFSRISGQSHAGNDSSPVISSTRPTDSPPLYRLSSSPDLTTHASTTGRHSTALPLSRAESSDRAVDQRLRQVLDEACPAAAAYNLDSIKTALLRQVELWDRLAYYELRKTNATHTRTQGAFEDAQGASSDPKHFSIPPSEKSTELANKLFALLGDVPFAPGVRLLTMLPFVASADDCEPVSTLGGSDLSLPVSPFSNSESCIVSLTGLLFPLDSTAPYLRAALRTSLSGDSADARFIAPNQAAARHTGISSGLTVDGGSLLRGSHFLKERLVKCFSLDQLLTTHGIYTKPVANTAALAPVVSPIPTPTSGVASSPLPSPLSFLTSLFTSTPPQAVPNTFQSSVTAPPSTSRIFALHTTSDTPALATLSPAVGLTNSPESSSTIKSDISSVANEAPQTTLTLLSIGYYPSFVHQFFRSSLAASGKESAQVLALGGLATGIDLSPSEGARAQRPTVTLRPDRFRRSIGRINSTPADVFRMRSFGRVSGTRSIKMSMQSSSELNSLSQAEIESKAESTLVEVFDDEEEAARCAGAADEIAAIAKLHYSTPYGVTIGLAQSTSCFGAQKRPPTLPPRPQSLTPDVLNVVTCPSTYGSILDACYALTVRPPHVLDHTSKNSSVSSGPRSLLEFVRALYLDGDALYDGNADTSSQSPHLAQEPKDSKSTPNPILTPETSTILLPMPIADATSPEIMEPVEAASTTVVPPIQVLVHTSPSTDYEANTTLNELPRSSPYDSPEHTSTESTPSFAVCPALLELTRNSSDDPCSAHAGEQANRILQSATSSIRSMVLAHVNPIAVSGSSPLTSARSIPYSARSRYQSSSTTREATPHLFAMLLKSQCAHSRRRCSQTLQALKNTHEFVNATIDPRAPADAIKETMARLWRALCSERSGDSQEIQSAIPDLPKDHRWKLLGFQSEFPLTDLRGMGSYSIEALIYLGTRYPDIAQELVRLQSVREYPLAASTINVVAYVVSLLSLPPKLIQSASTETETNQSTSLHRLAQLMGFPITSTTSDALFGSHSPLHRLLCLPSRLSPSEQILELIAQLLCLVDMLFASANAGYMQFPQVFAEVSERCSIALARHPPSFEAFLELLMATPLQET